MYNEGISYTGDLLNLGLKYGVLSRSGAWVGYKGENIAQGKEAAKEYFKENPKVAKEVEKLVREEIKKTE
jgi:recombination protein RecA